MTTPIKTWNARTWPYGTVKKATVIHTILDSNPKAILVKADDSEGFLLIGEETFPKDLAIDDKGEITFTQGGPTGGYWKFTKDKK